jgi:predicted Fe-Mo cluster-binding NifX family protein
VSTRIAIALFGQEVSPRFCFAPEALIVDVLAGREQQRFVASLGEPWLPRRISQLAAMGVQTLLCGAFNRAYLPTAEGLGIRVVTGVSGDAQAALVRFLGRQARPGGPGARRPVSGAGGRNHRRGCRGRGSRARP